MTDADTRRAPRVRRLALGAVAAIALLAGAALGAGDGGDEATRQAAPPPVTGAAAPGRLDVRAAVGQRIITAIDGVDPDAALLRLARQGRIGGVILFERNIRSVAQVRRSVDRLQAAAHAGGHPPLLVAVDQEGGTVKRFRALPPRRSPRATPTIAAARAEGLATARALRRAGVTVNLAPVADVTHDRRSFLYDRSYADPRRACAFAAGSRAGGVLPALKHFPGLGGAPANTDDASVTLTPSRATLRFRAAAYRACGDAGLVMIASARYRAFGPHPALLQRGTYAFLRSLGVRAATISDSLQARALAPEPHAAVRAVRAGVDLLLSTGSQAAANDIYLGVLGAVHRGDIDRGMLAAGAARIAALKARLG